MSRRGEGRKNICRAERRVRSNRWSGYRQTKENDDLHCKPRAPIGGASISHFPYLFAIHQRARQSSPRLAQRPLSRKGSSRPCFRASGLAAVLQENVAFIRTQFESPSQRATTHSQLLS